MENLICRRCNIGIDDDGDGNCSTCARWTDGEAWKVRRAVLRRFALSYVNDKGTSEVEKYDLANLSDEFLLSGGIPRMIYALEYAINRAGDSRAHYPAVDVLKEIKNAH